MSSLHARKDTIRRSFGKIKDIVPVPNLIEIQSRSFNEFAQLDFLPSERKAIGLEKVFRDIFPIDYNNKMSLEYVSYELGQWACTCGKLTGIVNRYTWSCLSCKKSDCSRLDDKHTCTFCDKHTARYKTCTNCLARVSIKLPLTLDECRSSGQTFSMPLRVKIQLISWDVDENEKKIVRDIKEQDIFFADIPVMVDLYEQDARILLGNLGTFLINGVDRVIVSQLHRSPGVVFSHSKKVKDVRGKPYFLARIIPMRGSWIDFEFDSNDLLYVRIDKKKKLLVTTFLQALGISREQIVPLFYKFDHIAFEDGDFGHPLDNAIIGSRIEKGMTGLKEKDEEPFAGKRVTKELLARLKKSGVDKLILRKPQLVNRIIGADVIDPETGEILVETGAILTDEVLDQFKKCKKLSFDLIASSGYVLQPTIVLTLAQDKTYTQDEALKELHAKMWPGDGASIAEAKEHLDNLLFNPRLYDLTRVGRIRMNRKLSLMVPDDVTTLTREDIVATLSYLVNLRERGEGELDDIDHLGNRRVRLVGELLTNQIYIGLLRIERIVRERFRLQEAHGALMPQDFLNVKPLSAVMREFFGTGQLSQFMDQTNPLAEIAHKRRLSALGPGGVMKDRATYEIRDVHTSHYGRICPIETPEGQTIGLISSLATYAMVNDLGFIETAYRPVINEQVQDRVVFLDAFEEAGQYIAQADAVKDGETITGKDVVARNMGNFLYVDADRITFVDLSPKQLVSVATALIPFLEHDDASRALMGANMQRQAVPLIRTQAPIVGTGMEKDIAYGSGACLTSKKSGFVDYVSSDRIVVRADESNFSNVEDWINQGVDIYYLRKFQRSSFSTWIHQTPVVEPGFRVEAGGLLTNAAAINNGELSLGANLLVAFMPWHGYNFEDAIVLNKRLVADDVLTSVHIDEYVADARETKLGPEEITRDIPNVSEIALVGLDEDGIVRIGTRVRPGDILVGKVTLKGDVQYSPEEKLLRAIFGEKSREVRDTSLRVPPGIEGTVIDVKIFSRSGVRKDKRYKEFVAKEVQRLQSEFEMHRDALVKMISQKVIPLLDGRTAQAKTAAKYLDNKVFSVTTLNEISFDELMALRCDDKKVNQFIEVLKDTFANQLRILAGLQEEKVDKLKRGDPLPSGVIKMVKVYIAMKRPIQVGDKLAGRHGNKGVVSVIVPREDMPYLDDGTGVDIVLNPIGVPSRMNVGQILETILGMAGRTLGNQLKVALEQGTAMVKKQLESYYGTQLVESYEETYGNDGLMNLARRTADNGVFYKAPVFDGGTFEGDIQPVLAEAKLPLMGTFRLRDGRTNEYFDQPVTVGSIYMMKLNHMVDDKLHARSVGPYSLVTQQPLGGKAQMGGQRFGEMEVWALEAYGAAYTLQEMLTYKSDDVAGRHKVYESIVRTEDVPEPGLPESFNVLIKELQSLGLRIDLFKSAKEDVGE